MRLDALPANDAHLLANDADEDIEPELWRRYLAILLDD
jgi:hypothetical protein